MVAITGQVRTAVIGKDAFQEADITGITMPITKHSYLVKRVEDLAQALAEAFYIAASGRPGPVLVDIPLDISKAIIEFDPAKDYPRNISIPSYKPAGPQSRIPELQLRKAAQLIAESQRPVLYVGGGAVMSDAQAEVTALAEKANLLTTTTLMGKGAIDETHALSMGMLGMHGTAYANHAVNQSDLLIAVGARFDDRVTGNVDKFATGAKIIHIDIDPSRNRQSHDSRRANCRRCQSDFDRTHQARSAAPVDRVERHDHWLEKKLPADVPERRQTLCGICHRTAQRNLRPRLHHDH